MGRPNNLGTSKLSSDHLKLSDITFIGYAGVINIYWERNIPTLTNNRFTLQNLCFVVACLFVCLIFVAGICCLFVPLSFCISIVTSFYFDISEILVVMLIDCWVLCLLRMQYYTVLSWVLIFPLHHCFGH